MAKPTLTYFLPKLPRDELRKQFECGLEPPLSDNLDLLGDYLAGLRSVLTRALATDRAPGEVVQALTVLAMSRAWERYIQGCAERARREESRWRHEPP